MTIKRCETMSELRSEINQVDRAIVELLAKRLRYIEQAARLKASRSSVRDEDRVRDVLTKVKAQARAFNSDEQMIDFIYRHLIEYSINHEFKVFDAKAG